MKKIIKILLLILITIPSIALAEGDISVSPVVINVEKGKTASITITATNTIGDAVITSNDADIATVNTSTWETGMVEEGQTKTGTITVRGENIGRTTITVVVSGATFDEEEINNEYTINVEVVEPTTTPTTTANNNNNNNNNNGNKENPNTGSFLPPIIVITGVTLSFIVLKINRR